jgi:hypothetical protein
MEDQAKIIKSLAMSVQEQLYLKELTMHTEEFLEMKLGCASESEEGAIRDIRPGEGEDLGDQEGQGIRESKADEAVKDESESGEDSSKLAMSLAKRGPEPSTTILRVNLAVKCAEEHPRQCDLSLWWVGHATEKVDLHRKIISWEKWFMGQDYEDWTKEAVQLILNKLSLFKFKQVTMDNVESEVVTYRMKANPGVTSVDEKTVKKLDGFLSFFHTKFQKKRPGAVPRSLCCWFCCGTHWKPCNGYSTVPV